MTKLDFNKPLRLKEDESPVTPTEHTIVEDDISYHLVHNNHEAWFVDAYGVPKLHDVRDLYAIENVPEVKTAYVNVHENGVTQVFSARMLADSWGATVGSRVIARVRIEYTEGQFDE